jgi:hypothetical protein
MEFRVDTKIVGNRSAQFHVMTCATVVSCDTVTSSLRERHF